VVFRKGPKQEEVLLIKRSVRPGDPWSGDMAFPGGRVEAQDSSFMAAAIRETREEVGADLSANARFLGYMRPFQARRRSILVVPSVFLASGPVSTRANKEVSTIIWVPLDDLIREENRSTYVSELEGARRTFPSFTLQGHIVWGLTERILSALVDSSAPGTGSVTSRRIS